MPLMIPWLTRPWTIDARVGAVLLAGVGLMAWSVRDQNLLG
jgi:hypothetical protein